MLSFSNFITEPVGNNLTNSPDDIRYTKNNLNALGFIQDDVNEEILTRDLDQGIKDFQEQYNLRRDGLLFPRGETEESVISALARISEEPPPQRGGFLPDIQKKRKDPLLILKETLEKRRGRKTNPKTTGDTRLS